MRHQEIIFGVAGQSFIYDCPEGRPASNPAPTVEVFAADADDEGATEEATTGSVSIDSVNTTLNGAISRGAVAATLTDGTGVTRGRRYLLGGVEWVEVASISGASVTFRHPVINDHDDGATFEGTRLSIAVDASWVQDENNISDFAGMPPGASGYRLRWTYTANGEATLGVSYADLVRYQAKNLVTPLDVDRTFPGWIDRLSTDYRADQGAALIDEAFQALKMDALTDAQLVRRMRDTQVIAELVKYRANLLAVQTNVLANGGDPRTLDIARDLYDQRYNALVREPKIAVDHTGDGANGEAKRLPVWRR